MRKHLVPRDGVRSKGPDNVGSIINELQDGFGGDIVVNVEVEGGGAGCSYFLIIVIKLHL
jgi:hypothetical protein